MKEQKNTDHSDQFLKYILDSMPDMIGYWDKDLRCRFANHAYNKWFDKRPLDVIGITFEELAGEQLFAINKPYIHKVLAGEPQRFERTLVRDDATVGHIIGHYIPDFDVDGNVQGFSSLASEVTELKETEAQLKLAACVFENTLDGVLISDADGIILSVNPAFSEITGYGEKEVIGKNPRILKSSRHDKTFYATMWNDIKTKGRWQGEIWNRRKSGDLYLERMTISMVRGDDGKPIRYVSVFTDITALWHQDEHIKHLAFYDALTDLPNRTLMIERINQKLINSNREPCNLALLFLDLDGFKLVNDQHGHNIGDDLLKEVAKRLLALVRECDTVARLGGDEFICILNNPQGKDEIVDIAHRILASLNQPIEICAKVLQIGVSIGIAIFPDHGSSCEALIKNADIAMYAAKSLGRNNVHFFTPPK